MPTHGPLDHFTVEQVGDLGATTIVKFAKAPKPGNQLDPELRMLRFKLISVIRGLNGRSPKSVTSSPTTGNRKASVSAGSLWETLGDDG